MAFFPIEVLLVLRFLKLAAVLALAAGTVGAFLPRALEDRQRAAYALAGPGLLATLGFGVAIAWGQGISLLSAWIVGATVLSLLSLQVVLWSVGREGRRNAAAALIALGALACALALMVWKPTLGGG
jgi:hypothetical protein